MAPSQNSPRGLKLGESHTVGNLIGEGAFGAVYAVKGRGQWASKIVAVPTKATKNRKSSQEIAFDRLSSENMLYSNHFGHLCGTLLPKRPSEAKDGLKVYERGLKGYSCLTMERMELLFFDILPSLVNASKGNVPLGMTACKLIELVSSIHEKHYLVLDCKPDNLMIAQSPRTVSDKTVASNLRMVDLGLVKPFSECGKHKEDTGTSEVQGTPLYASLNVHELCTPSRRDDLESFLYIIAEMVLIVNGLVKGEDPPYGSGKDRSFLPWSTGKSDDEIYQIKKKCVEDLKSVFYQKMPIAAAQILFECIQLARGTGFKKKPAYETFLNMLSDLSVPILAKRASRKSKTPSKKTARSRTAPVSSKKSRTARNAAAKKPPPEEIIEIESSDSDVEMEDVSSGDEEMLSSSDEEDDEISEGVPTPKKKVPVMQLVGLESPILLAKGQSIIIGSNPQVQGSVLMVDDDSLRATHIRIELERTIKNTVRVTPLLRAEVLVEGQVVQRSGTVVFSEQTIQFGNQLLTVKRLPKRDTELESDVAADENRKPAAKPTSTRTTRSSARVAQAKKESADAYIKITCGSQEGRAFAFTKSQSTMIVGSAPTRKGIHVTLADSKDIESNHATLTLSVNKGIIMCKITNLSKKGTTLDEEVIPVGQSREAFCGSSISIGKVKMELVRTL